MRARIALSLVAALVGCKARSEQDRSERDTSTAPTSVPGRSVGGYLGAGSGSGTAGVPTPPIGGQRVTSDPGTQHAEIARSSAGSADPAPAAPTPARPDTAVAPRANPDEGHDEVPGLAQAAPGDGSGGGSGVAPGRLTIASGKALDPSTLTADDVTAKITAAYLPGLARCFRADASAKTTGTVTLTFTVAPNGRVDGATGANPDAALGRCVHDRATTWRFRVPTDPATMKPAPVRFAYAFALTPD